MFILASAAELAAAAAAWMDGEGGGDSLLIILLQIYREGRKKEVLQQQHKGLQSVSEWRDTVIDYTVSSKICEGTEMAWSFDISFQLLKNLEIIQRTSTEAELDSKSSASDADTTILIPTQSLGKSENKNENGPQNGWKPAVEWDEYQTATKQDGKTNEQPSPKIWWHRNATKVYRPCKHERSDSVD